MTNENITVKATARDAGRNVVHTVTRSDGGQVYDSVRRSVHRYDYAICRWVRTRDNRKWVVVSRWSRSSKATGMDFAVKVENI